MRLALIVAVLWLAAPAAAQAAYRDFRSPSGKLGCAFYSDAEVPPMVRCDWQGADDEAIVLRETGRARPSPPSQAAVGSGQYAVRLSRGSRTARPRCSRQLRTPRGRPR